MFRTLSGLIRFILCWVVTAFLWCSALFVALFLPKQIVHYLLWRTARLWSYALLKILSIRINIKGAKELKGEKGRVIIFNHQSTLDFLCMAAVVPKNFTIIGKKELRYIPVVNLFWWLTGATYIDRSNSEAAIACMKQLAKKLKESSSSLFIAPEGTRSPSGELLAFKKGAFHIAIDAGLPIYPVVISRDAFKLWPKQRLWPKSGGSVEINCLKPVDTSNWSKSDLTKEIACIHAEIRSVLDAPVTNASNFNIL